MLGDIFYILGLFTLIFSFSNLINYSKYWKIKQWYIAFQKVSNREIIRKDFRDSKDYNIFTMFHVFNLVEISWLVLGICTKSWLIFLILLAFELFKFFILKKLKYKLFTNFFGLTFQFFKFLLILILILNHFHFHQDILVTFVHGFHKF
jgi:hypothetical protein